jgi:hypothetical protein
MSDSRVAVRFQAEAKTLRIVHTANDAEIASYLMSTGLKWPGRDADCLPAYNVRGMNAWSYIPSPSYVLMEWCLIN